MRNVVLLAIVLALAIAAIEHQSGSSTSGGGQAAAGSSANSGFLAAQHKYDRMWGDRATDDELMIVGRSICALRGKGLSDMDILVRTAGYRPPSGSRARTLGLQRIHDAKKYLCP